MANFNITVQDNKVPFFKELIASLDFVKIRETGPEKLTAEQQEFVDDLKGSLKQVKLHQEGKIKLQSAKDFLNEL